MNQEKIVEKIISNLQKNKPNKVDKILLKNKNNIELFDILLQTMEFNSLYLEFQIDESIFKKFSIDVQKKLIEHNPSLIRMASDEIRDDKNYIELMEEKLNENEKIKEHVGSFYEFIGPALSKDKEFLKNIQDKYPLVFLRSTTQIDYSIEELKSFFNKYPEYIASLPNNLKNDYEYLSSLMEKIKKYNEDTLSHYLNFEYDYLKTEQVKSIIINNFGENLYNRILIYALVDDPKQYKILNSEEFKKLVMMNPDIFCDSNDRLQNLIGFGNKNLELINTISQTSRTTFSKVDSPQKLTDILFKLSKSFEYNLTYEQILNNVNSNWNNILPWIEQIDDEYRLDNGKLEVNNNQNVFRKIYNLLLGIECNKLEDMFKIFYNSELRNSTFAGNIKNIDVTEDNISFLQLICTTDIFKSDQSSIEMFNKLFSKISKWNNDPYSTVNFIENLSKDSNLYNLLMNENIENINTDILLNLYNYIDIGLNSFLSKITNLTDLENYDKIIDDALNNFRLEDIKSEKQKTLIKHFQIDLSKANYILHSYLSSTNTQELYKNMPEALYLKQLLEKVVNASNKQELKKIENILNKEEVKISFRNIEKIISNIKGDYGKKINESLLKKPNTNGIIDVTNTDFNLLVHVIGAYGSVPTGNIYESWNTQEKTSNVSICTSFISDNNMGIARTNKHSVVLGFSDLPNDFLELMSSQDMYSRGFKANRESNFMTPEELKNNTRHGHNELVIRRRKGEFTEEKLEPSYIICFDNVNEESKKAAQQFNIPILYIDREKVAKKHHFEIENKIQQFSKTLDSYLIKEIITEQENNKSGLRLTRPDLVEKYFSKDYRQKNIDIIFSTIDNAIKNNNPKAIVAMNEFVQVIETEKNKYDVINETTDRKNEFDIKYEEYLEYFKNNPNYNCDFELKEKLSVEELYQKFIECRDKLSQKERIELQQINNNMNINLEDNIVDLRK